MIGRRIAEEALARGHRVTAIARDPAKLDLRHERLAAARETCSLLRALRAWGRGPRCGDQRHRAKPGGWRSANGRRRGQGAHRRPAPQRRALVLQGGGTLGCGGSSRRAGAKKTSAVGTDRSVRHVFSCPENCEEETSCAR
ncbi:MAG: hypothetical protein M3436_15865 [Pseudomonadota bacterium]|nr:hypothetical protein [Pseudomonadota bacterium]